MIDKTINPMAEYPYPPLKAEKLDAIRPYKHFTSNSKIVEALIETLGGTITEEEKRNLGNYVYLARQQFREEDKQAQLAELAKDGYVPFTAEVAEKLDGQKIQLKGKYQYDWYSSNIDSTCKVRVLESGVFLIPDGKRSRGYYLHNLDMPVYKLTN